MTCIVGLVEDGKVYIGGDTAGTDSGFDIQTRLDTKVFTLGSSMALGFTTSFRMGQLLNYKLHLPDHDPRNSNLKYLVTDFTDAVMKVFKDNEYSEYKDSVASGGTFLIGYKGCLYAMYSDFQIAQVADSYLACGCGERYALGALKILTENNKKMSAEDKVTKALEAAAHHNAGVRGPFNIVIV